MPADPQTPGTSATPGTHGTPGRPADGADPADGLPRDLPPAARRALAEAEARRRATPPVARPVELGGRDGPEPVRYGDWERKGLAIDF